MNDIDIFVIFGAAVVGLILGSFYTACIHRWIVGQSIANPPRSKCPTCGHTLCWWENIPLLSYIMLRGCCRKCRTPISFRYPAVEAVSCLLSVLLMIQHGPSFENAAFMILFGILIVASFIDFAEYLLPDVLTLPGAALALGFAPLAFNMGFFDALAGSLLGAGVFWLLMKAYKIFRGSDGLGLGDVKLMLMLGAMTGPAGLPLTVLIGATSALAASAYYIIANRRHGGETMQTMVPFGPFLSLGAIVEVLYGERLMDWWMGSGL